MIPSTPYLPYILGAYGVTLMGLGIFLGRTFFQWKKSTSQLKTISREI